MGSRRRLGGFTLVEIMIVVAILGVLAATAAPTYLRYIQGSKQQVLRNNALTAVSLVRNEISKRNAGSLDFLDTPADFASALNSGNKRSVYDSSLDAFATAGNDPGTVVISKDLSVVPNTYEVSAIDAAGSPLTGFTVTLVLE